MVGRKNWEVRLRKQLADYSTSPIWFHCASLGEFEQGRPLMELIKEAFPEQPILLTFFSPSGYEIRKNYQGVEGVSYLPLDTKQNAQAFLEIVRPKLAIFIKYELWYHFIKTLKARHIPTYLVGAVFRPNQYFFKWYGKEQLSLLSCFEHIFVQDLASKKLLTQHQIGRVSIAGDPRIDRVFQISQRIQSFPLIERFKAGKDLFIAGSTHPKDIALLLPFIQNNSFWKILIVPHEIGEADIQSLENALPNPSLRYTNINASTQLEETSILILDTIGMLNQVYQYGAAAYIGGGFDSSIHNTLEPAVFGLPILIGPKYQKFEEAKALVQQGGIKVVNTAVTIIDTLEQWEQASERTRRGQINLQYLKKHQGGTAQVFSEFQQLLV